MRIKFDAIGILLCISIFSSGCTGMKVVVNPSPELLKNEFSQKFNTVSVKEMPAIKIYPPAGWIAQDFARELEISGFVKAVYFPSRPDDKADAILESKFEVEMEPHLGKSMLKAFFTGFTFFILEPVFWYNFDYTFTSTVDVVYGNKRIPVTAKTNSSLSLKWLSLFQAQKNEAELIKDSKLSMFRQLIDKINNQETKT